MRICFAVIAAAPILLAGPALAGPCTGEIHDLEVEVNAKLDAIAGHGKTARQSTAAQMHRQPTPNTLANAEVEAGDISDADVTRVRQFIAQARQADGMDDLATCHKALADARVLMKF